MRLFEEVPCTTVAAAGSFLRNNIGLSWLLGFSLVEVSTLRRAPLW